MPLRKKIIFFLPTLSIGGGERVVSELSLNLPDSVDKTIVLFKNEVSYPYKGNLICLDIPLSNPVLLRIYYFFVGIWRFKKIIRKEKPDYVISFGEPANIINVLSNRKTILRIDNYTSALPGVVYKIFIKILYNETPMIVCVSKTAAKDLTDNFGIKENKIKVIYNPLNVKDIQKLSLAPLETPYEEIFKKPVIINMGRLTKQKSQWHLIRAFKKVKGAVPSAKLVILGTGELEQELKKTAEDLGLGKDVHFLGWQKNPFKFLARANVFALSSLWEGLPYVVLEAMACGLPVVSVDCKSGPREILAPETDISREAKDIEYEQFGILTPAFDGKKYGATDPLIKSEEILTKALIKILTDKELSVKLSQKSLQRANDFDTKTIIREWSFLEK
jgi:glycosyltransferase involved in cell wall biosynthesis